MTDEADRPYSGQEGDINEKLLLDLAWERQQKKVRMASTLARGGSLLQLVSQLQVAAYQLEAAMLDVGC